MIFMHFICNVQPQRVIKPQEVAEGSLRGAVQRAEENHVSAPLQGAEGEVQRTHCNIEYASHALMPRLVSEAVLPSHLAAVASLCFERPSR